MSSVLIGIIGIALFMGIAIGSAIFLGPRFEDAQSQSLGSSSIQAVSTVASAVSSYRMATGYAYGAGLEDVQKLVDAGFLRSVPANSVVPSRAPQIIGSNGVNYSSSSATQQAIWSPKAVVMSLGTDRSVCSQIERMLGNIDSGQEVDDTTVSPITATDAKAAGCFRTNRNSFSVSSGDYVVYVRVGGA